MCTNQSHRPLLVLILCLLATMPMALACPNDAGGHYTRFTFLDANGKVDLIVPIANANVTVTRMMTEEGLWYMNWFGLTELDIPQDSISYVTNDKGQIEVTVYPAMKYQIDIRNKTYYLYPNENEYYFLVRDTNV